MINQAKLFFDAFWYNLFKKHSEHLFFDLKRFFSVKIYLDYRKMFFWQEDISTHQINCLICLAINLDHI